MTVPVVINHDSGKIHAVHTANPDEDAKEYKSLCGRYTGYQFTELDVFKVDCEICLEFLKGGHHLNWLDEKGEEPPEKYPPLWVMMMKGEGAGADTITELKVILEEMLESTEECLEDGAGTRYMPPGEMYNRGYAAGIYQCLELITDQESSWEKTEYDTEQSAPGGGMRIQAEMEDKQMEYYKLDVDDKLLEAARQAVNEGIEKNWSMGEVAGRYAELVSEYASEHVFVKGEINAAIEQASYILDYEPGYEEGREYPVEQK